MRSLSLAQSVLNDVEQNSSKREAVAKNVVAGGCRCDLKVSLYICILMTFGFGADKFTKVY